MGIKLLIPQRLLMLGPRVSAYNSMYIYIYIHTHTSQWINSKLDVEVVIDGNQPRVSQSHYYEVKLRATSHTSQELWPRNWRAQKKVSKGHLPNHVVWSHIWHRALNQILDFNEFLFMRVFTQSINGCESLECIGLPVVLCQVCLQEMSFENSPSDHETWSHSMPCRNPCRLYTHRGFTNILRWSLKFSVPILDVWW